jgi:hypothetical protein
MADSSLEKPDRPQYIRASTMADLEENRRIRLAWIHSHPTPLNRSERILDRFYRASDELDKLNDRLEEIESERALILPQIEKLATIIEVLEPICEELDEEKVRGGITDWEVLANCGIQECCYRVLCEAQEPMDAASIRDALAVHGINMKQVNPLAVIHTSLKRIPDRVRSFKRKRNGGKDGGLARYYECIG